MPLFKLSRRSNLKAATQMITLNHVILGCFSNTLSDRIFTVWWRTVIILGNPGATNWDDAIFSGKNLLPELKSPWELVLTEPVLVVVEFRPADWPEKYFSAQSARRSSRVTRSPSYTKQFSPSIDLVAWRLQCIWKVVVERSEKIIQRSRGNR